WSFAKPGVSPLAYKRSFYQTIEFKRGSSIHTFRKTGLAVHATTSCPSSHADVTRQLRPVCRTERVVRGRLKDTLNIKLLRTERCEHRRSQCRVPVSQIQKCERVWPLLSDHGFQSQFVRPRTTLGSPISAL